MGKLREYVLALMFGGEVLANLAILGLKYQ